MLRTQDVLVMSLTI